jgi:hypothetical protein
VKIVREASGGQWPAAAISIYGTTATRSEYDFEQAVAIATPTQLTYFMPRVKEVRTCIFVLFFKQLEIVNAETGFYSFQTERLRGFQNGDPRKAKSVTVKAFDGNDNQFEFIFSNRQGLTGSITQTDINMVLQTLRPAPASPLEPAVK